MSDAIYSKDHKYIVEKLKQARLDIGLDQDQVAGLLKRTQSYVSKIESGQRKIGVVQLKAFAHIYKKPIEFFIN